jgi:hypothetical protein
VLSYEQEGLTEEMLGSIQEQIKTNWKTLKDESGDFFEINCEISNETMAAFFVTGRMNKRVQDGSDLCKIDGGLLNQGQNESGEKVDSAGVPVEMRFQGVLEFSMLFRRASNLSSWEAPIVSYGVLDGHRGLMSGTMPERIHAPTLEIDF